MLAAIVVPISSHAAQRPDVHAAAYILIETESGRVISEYQAHRRMFPAATTMILTAILAYEHIGMDEIIVVGNEIHALPGGSARNWHETGEAITGANLLRGMLIGAGNDTANVVAMEVARRTTDNPNISFLNAQVVFANLMTQRARELGALDSSFVNPHGYHHDSHFTTAYDMAQIALHALSLPELAEILALPSYFGPMWGDDETLVPEGATMLSRNWSSPNLLLHENSDFHYEYAIGLRTGRTNQAGDSLVSAAARDGITLISVTFNSPEIAVEIDEDGELIYEPTRWQDNIGLFEYGFANYAHRVFLQEGAIIDGLPIYDPRIDDPGYLEFFAAASGMLFLNDGEIDRLERNIEFAPGVVTYTEEYGQMFVTPIYENDMLGTVSYYLDGRHVFTTDIHAVRYVPERTTASDIEVRMESIHNFFFSTENRPWWIAGGSVLVLIIVAIVLVRRHIVQKRRRNYKYKWKY